MICKNCLGPIGYTGGRYDENVIDYQAREIPGRRRPVLEYAGAKYHRYLCSSCIDRGYKIDTRDMKVAQN